MNSKTKILHVLPWIMSGGVERRRLNMIKYLNADVYEHIVICKEASGAIAQEMQDLGVTFIVVEGQWSFYELDSIAKIAQIIQQQAPDIVHGAVFEGVMMAALAGYVAGHRLVLTEETSGNPARSINGHFLTGLASMLSKKVVAVSNSTLNYLEHFSFVPPEKIQLIKNGVDMPKLPTSKETQALRKSLDLEKDAIILGCVGRVFDTHKRFSDVLQAFAQLDRTKTPINLVIVGDGPDLGMLKKLARTLNVDQWVRFIGYAGNVSQYYGLMDIFVHTPSFEAFGLVVIEAMGATLPVVVSDVGELPFLIEHEQTGMIVPAKQPDALVVCLNKLIASPECRQTISQNASELAHQHYTRQRYIKDVDALYQHVLGQA